MKVDLSEEEYLFIKTFNINKEEYLDHKQWLNDNLTPNCIILLHKIFKECNLE